MGGFALAAQNIEDALRVFFGAAALNVVQAVGRFNTEVRRRKGAAADRAVSAEFRVLGFAVYGRFIGSGAVHHKGAAHTLQFQNVCNGLKKCRTVDADHGVVGMRGVRERPQNIENCPGFEFRPHGAGKAHRRVIELGVAEGKARVLQKLCAFFRRCLDVKAKGRENV